MTDEEAHDALAKLAREHSASDAAVVDSTDKIGAFMGAAGQSADKPRTVLPVFKVPPVMDFGEGMDLTEQKPPGSTLEQTGNAMLRGGIWGKPEDGGPGGDPSAGLPKEPETPKGEPFTVSGEVAKMVAGAAQPKTKPRVNLGAPIGAPKDTELAGLQADAASKRSAARVGDAVTNYTERPTNLLDYAERLGGGGVSAPPRHNSMWDDYAKEGEQNISDLKEKRASEGAMATAAAGKEATAAKKDPNSETAKVYRSVLLKFAPDLEEQLSGATPEQMEHMAPWLEKYATENGVQLKANAAATAKAKEDEERKRTHDEDKVESGRRADQFHQDAQDNAAATRQLAGAQFNFGKQKFAADEADKETRAKDAADAKDQAGAQHLGDKAGEGQTVAKALDDIDAVIAKNPNDIPGVGKWKSKLPDFVAGSVLSDEGVSVRNNARDVLGTLLHKRSGAAVSPAELSRYETMFGLNGTDEQFKAGVARMRRDFAAELSSTQAGVSPGARAKFKEAGGMLAEDIDKKGAPATTKPSPGAGYVRGAIDGKPGWINKAAGEWEPD